MQEGQRVEKRERSPGAELPARFSSIEDLEGAGPSWPSATIWAETHSKRANRMRQGRSQGGTGRESVV